MQQDCMLKQKDTVSGLSGGGHPIFAFRRQVVYPRCRLIEMLSSRDLYRVEGLGYYASS